MATPRDHLRWSLLVRSRSWSVGGVRGRGDGRWTGTGLPGEHAADIHTHVRDIGYRNKIHYVRNTTWKEDANQAWVGSGPHAMAILRNLAIGLFRLRSELRDHGGAGSGRAAPR